MFSNNLRGYLVEELPLFIMVKNLDGLELELLKNGFHTKVVGKHINVFVESNIDICAVEAISASVNRKNK